MFDNINTERTFGTHVRFNGGTDMKNSINQLSTSELRELKIRRNRIRRQRQLRRRVAIGIAAIIIILSSSLGLTSFLSKAAETPDEYKVKTYSSVMVPFGSGLKDLARVYTDFDYYDSYVAYIKEVMFINHLSDEDVRPGNYLILPVYVDSTELG